MKPSPATEIRLCLGALAWAAEELLRLQIEIGRFTVKHKKLAHECEGLAGWAELGAQYSYAWTRLAEEKEKAYAVLDPRPLRAGPDRPS